jgi:hypothetical protein
MSGFVASTRPTNLLKSIFNLIITSYLSVTNTQLFLYIAPESISPLIDIYLTTFCFNGLL